MRPIEEDDFPEWFRFRKLLWDESTDAEHRAEMIDIIEHIETQLVLVAEVENGRLIGFLEASIRPFVEDCHSEHVGYFEGWFVEEDFRQHGIGQKISSKSGRLGAKQRMRRNGFGFGNWK